MNVIPSYVLYGERDLGPYLDVLHCEKISFRCQLHNWQFRAHRHHDLQQFFWLTRGSGMAVIDGRQHVLSAGSAMAIPPTVVHSFVFDRRTEGWVATIPRGRLDQSTAEMGWVGSRLARPVVLDPSATRPHAPEIESILRLILSEYGTSRIGRAGVLTGLSGLLAAWFARVIAAADEPGHSAAARGVVLARRFRESVDQRFRSDHRLDAYAAALGVTPAHLSRACREVLGKPASAIIRDRVLQEAMRELTYTTTPIGDIAEALGFSDPGHFSKFFVQRTGSPPIAFRRRSTALSESSDGPAMQ